MAERTPRESLATTERRLRIMIRIPCLGLMLFALPVSASVPPPSPNLRHTLSVEREQQLWKPPLRSAEFADVPHTNARSRCEDTQPPEALATPDPLLVPHSAGGGIKVSFIVGTDGRVHSPLILKSAGPAGDRNVLETIRAWRYRPATCNGVPTESEARIEFR